MQICSLSTIAREYVGLHSISSLPYKDLILTAADSIKNSDEQAWKISKPLMEYIQTNHNSTQLEAIHVSFHRFLTPVLGQIRFGLKWDSFGTRVRSGLVNNP